jgi:glucosamine--fructose-6-phosphate aminotransferase (isomerizing)
MTSTDVPAALMGAEIREQPAVWRRLLGSEQFGPAAQQVLRRRPRMVLLAARGTSDHAALYVKYLVEVIHQLPAGLVSPSTMTAYGAKPDLRDVLMFGISQSGVSPDLIQTLEVARAQGRSPSRSRTTPGPSSPKSPRCTSTSLPGPSGQ